MMGKAACFLGVDLGTSKVALALCEPGGRAVEVRSAVHGAERAVEEAGRAEQDAETIARVAEGLLEELGEESLRRVGAIGMTGQMHGVLQYDARGEVCSPLVTWQDARSEGVRIGGRWIPPGYGLATIRWWAERGMLVGSGLATVHGWLAMRWCGLSRARMDPTDWDAWGGDPVPEGVPVGMLPERVDHGVCIGRTVGGGRLPGGIPVAAPLGDHQASIRATVREPEREAALVIGTGCQLSVLMGREAMMADSPVESRQGAEVRPFDGDRILWTAAPRAGGAAWAWLAERVRGWVGELGYALPTVETVYARLDTLGLEAGAKVSGEPKVRFTPHLDGERYDAGLTAALSGLRYANGTLGEIARGVAAGIVENAQRMLPPACLMGRERVVASGNALRRSALLRREAERVLGLPLVLLEEGEEAAIGAALVAEGMMKAG